MDVQKIIHKKLSGSPLADAELEFVIMSYLDNTIPDSIMTDFLKSVHQNGMIKSEIISLTRIMIDSGEIIAQKKFKLSKFDTIRSIQLKTYLLEPSLILLAIKNINNNKKLKINNKIKRKMYKRTPSDSQIDPKKSLLKLYDSIRASDPKEFPSFFIINKKKVYIKLSTSKKFIIKKDFSL